MVPPKSTEEVFMSSEVRRILLALLLPGVLMVAAEPSSGIVVSDDPDLHEVAAPSDFDGVGYLNTVGGSSAAVIHPWYVLTAGHCVNNIINGTFTLHLANGPHVYNLEERWIHPTADIAVVRLSANTGMAGYGLYGSSSESGEEGILVGYGMSGLGDNVGPGGDPNYPRGTKRYGYNRIDSIYTDPQGVRHLKTDFDSPQSSGPFGTLGADKEVMFAEGDSGGPTFIESGVNLLVAGIHVSIPYKDPDHWPEYGDTGYDVRVSYYDNWIADQIAGVPGPQTGDFNRDGGVDELDIDALMAEIHSGGGDLWYDLTGDDVVDQADADDLLHVKIGIEYGDANMDEFVDGLDYAIWSNHYSQTGLGWTKGNFNGDAAVDGLDYVVWSNHYMPQPGAPGRAVPEPATLGLLALGALVLVLRRRRWRPKRKDRSR